MKAFLAGASTRRQTGVRSLQSTNLHAVFPCYIFRSFRNNVGSTPVRRTSAVNASCGCGSWCLERSKWRRVCCWRGVRWSWAAWTVSVCCIEAVWRSSLVLSPVDDLVCTLSLRDKSGVTCTGVSWCWPVCWFASKSCSVETWEQTSDKSRALTTESVVLLSVVEIRWRSERVLRVRRQVRRLGNPSRYLSVAWELFLCFLLKSPESSVSDGEKITL